MQDDFSFSQVAVGAITGAFAGALREADAFQGLRSTEATARYGAQAAEALTRNFVGQVANIAFNQQEGFSWAGLAASAITAPFAPSTAGTKTVGEFAKDTLKGIAVNSVQQLVENNGKLDFVTVASDAFGNALGNSIVGAIRQGEIQQEVESLSERGQQIFEDVAAQTGDERAALEFAQRASSLSVSGDDSTELLGLQDGSLLRPGQIELGLEGFESSGQLLNELSAISGEGYISREHESAIRERYLELRSQERQINLDRSFTDGVIRGFADASNGSDPARDRLAAQDFNNVNNWGRGTFGRGNVLYDPLSNFVDTAVVGGSLLAGGIGAGALGASLLRFGGSALTRSLGAANLGYGADLSIAAGRTILNQEVANTGLNTGLQALGLSEAAAGYTEAALGLGLASSGALASLGRNSQLTSVAERRAYLNAKYERSGDLNLDINIRGNREIAANFYRQSGFSDLETRAHLAGIDFSSPVEVARLGRGQLVYQWDAPSTSRGQYFALLERSTPSDLGVSPNKIPRGTNTIFSRTQIPMIVNRPVYGLRSTAAPIVDSWSVRGTSFPAVGGSRQFFTTDTSAFRLNSRAYYGN